MSWDSWAGGKSPNWERRAHREASQAQRQEGSCVLGMANGSVRLDSSMLWEQCRKEVWDQVLKGLLGERVEFYPGGGSRKSFHRKVT